MVDKISIKYKDLQDEIDKYTEMTVNKEHRCPDCGQLLFKGKFSGHLEIKCRRCKKLVIYEMKK
jgi:DNA-directed RNA polymerase subunit RPC12/RpoP